MAFRVPQKGGLFQKPSKAPKRINPGQSKVSIPSSVRQLPATTSGPGNQISTSTVSQISTLTPAATQSSSSTLVPSIPTQKEHDQPNTQATLVSTQPTQAHKINSSLPPSVTQPPDDTLVSSPPPSRTKSSLPPTVTSSTTSPSNNTKDKANQPTRDTTTPAPETPTNRQTSQAPLARRRSPTPSIASRTSGRGRPSLIAAAAATPLLPPPISSQRVPSDSPAPATAPTPIPVPVPGLPPKVTPSNPLPAARSSGLPPALVSAPGPSRGDFSALPPTETSSASTRPEVSARPPTSTTSTHINNSSLRDRPVSAAGQSMRSSNATPGAQVSSTTQQIPADRQIRSTPLPSDPVAASKILIAEIEAQGPKTKKRIRSINKNGKPRKVRTMTVRSEPYPPRRPRSDKGIKKGPRKRTRSIEEDVVDSDQSRERTESNFPVDEEGNRLPQRRGEYRRGRIYGTEHDKRLRHNRAKRARARVDLPGGDDQEMHVDGPEDEAMEIQEPRMCDLTRDFYQEGENTELALKLHAKVQADSEARSAAKAMLIEEQNKRNQIIRRKLRASRNDQRLQRKAEMEADGRTEDDIADLISDLEEDSEIEHEFEPERLTPPGTPEPERSDDGYDEHEEVHGEVEEAEGEYVGNGNQESLVPEIEQHEDGDDNDNIEGQMENGEDEGHQAGDDLLAAMGYRVEGEEEEEEYEYDEHGNIIEHDESYDLGEDEMDMAQFRARRDRAREAQMRLRDGNIVEEDDEETRMTNQSTYSKNPKGIPMKWTEQDTTLLYEVIREVGENYFMIATYFPGRTVRQIKRRVVFENKRNPEKMTAAIMNRKLPDQAYLTKAIGYQADRTWEREEALFEEARQDKERLRALDLEEAENGGGEEEE